MIVIADGRRQRAGGIDGGHITQSQNDDWRQRGQMIQDVGELIRGAEQEWAMNAIHRGVLGNVSALQDVRAAILDVIARYPADGGGSRDLPDEHQRRQNHADLDRKGKIRDDRKSQSQQPHGDVRGGQLQDFGNFAPLAHVVRHDHQNGGEGG